VARGLGPALRDAGYNIHAVASRTPATASLLAQALDCEATSAQGVTDTCDLAFLTVPDDAIAPVADALRWRAGQFVVHCSGATEVSALGSATTTGAHSGGFHPLQSFTQDGATLAGCTVTVEAEAPLFDTLETMVQALGCRLNHLPPGQRAVYHASAGYGSRFINVLMAEIAELWGEWGASEADTMAAILPMARATLDAIERQGIAPSMPGPVSRGDAGSVAAHVKALAQQPDALDFYRAHCLRSITIAQAAGRIDSERAEAIRHLLTNQD